MFRAIRRFPGLTVTVLVVLAVLLKLGFWQLERLSYKTELVARIETGLRESPSAFPSHINAPSAWQYKRVILSGEFDHAREIHLFGMSVDGKGGYHILTPLLRPQGITVLVDRGWVPKDRRDPATRSAGQIAGPVRITGISRMPLKAGLFAPAPDIPGNEWYALDLPAMGTAVGHELADVIVEADRTPNPGGLPVGGQTRVKIPNDHLGYAVTWFGFALVLVVIYIVYVRRRR